MNSTDFPESHWLFRFLDFAGGDDVDWKYCCRIDYDWDTRTSTYDSCKLAWQFLWYTASLSVRCLGVFLAVFVFFQPIALCSFALLSGVGWEAAVGDYLSNVPLSDSYGLGPWIVQFSARLGGVLLLITGMVTAVFTTGVGLFFAGKFVVDKMKGKSPRPRFKDTLAGKMYFSVKDKTCWKINVKKEISHKHTRMPGVSAPFNPFSFQFLF